MQTLTEFLDHMATIPGPRVVDEAAAVLARSVAWAALAADHLERLADAELVRLVLKATIPHVQPRVYMIAEIPGHLQVILHHFDRPLFDRYSDERRIGPHYHHFPFTTRILRGNYVQWLFRNQGTLPRPDLEFERQVRCVADDIYTLVHDRFHCVFAPEHDAMTLMIRGPAIFDPGHGPEDGYGPAEILGLRPRLVGLLRAQAEARPGRVLDIDGATDDCEP